MKKHNRINIIIALCLLITACGQVSQVTPSPIPSPTIDEKALPTITLVPSATAISAIYSNTRVCSSNIITNH